MVGISYLHILNGTFKEVGMNIAEDMTSSKVTPIRVHQLMLPSEADLNSGYQQMLVESSW